MALRGRWARAATRTFFTYDQKAPQALARAKAAKVKADMAATDDRESRTLAANEARGGPTADGENPLLEFASGLAGAAYDSTVGAVSNAANAATHVDQIVPNLELAGVALAHLDMTAQIASADLSNGVGRFGSMSLADKVRFVADILAAAVGPQGLRPPRRLRARSSRRD